jgi:hypothetical protein
VRDLSDWKVRAFYLSCLILVPFLKFLVRNEYGFLYPEVLAGVSLLAVVCVLLALVMRGTGFYLLIVFTVTLTATYPARGLAGFLSAAPPWAIGTVIASATWLLLQRMRANFFLVLAVFTWSGLPVETMMRAARADLTVHASSAKPASHILWLILDEQIGLAGLPANLPECVSARERLQRTLQRYNFTLFPHAYSNYPVTVDSVASILTGRLVKRPEELMPRSGSDNLRHYAIEQNRLFEEFAAKGYQVSAWQHGALQICGAPSSGVQCQEYAEKLKWLHRAPGGWLPRFRWLVSSYQSGDPWLLRVKGFFPFRFGIKITGPLALEGLWPDGLAAGLLGESRATLTFAHLMTPHSPYLYRRDGSIRPLEEWADDRADHRVSERDYRDLYCRYCEQVEFVASQLDQLLLRLDRGGLLRGMTVVIHGDHGSRILHSLRPADRTGSISPELLDFNGEPDSRDLVDRFSTLLAVKRAGAAAPAICDEKHSLLTFLARVVLGREPQDGAGLADEVYLADSRQRLHAIDIQHYWK